MRGWKGGEGGRDERVEGGRRGRGEERKGGGEGGRDERVEGMKGWKGEL